jgi:hypothetical protein
MSRELAASHGVTASTRTRFLSVGDRFSRYEGSLISFAACIDG